MTDELDRELLVSLMAAMAAGDNGVVLTFIDSFGHRVAGVMRRHLRDMGHGYLATDDQEVDGLVIDAAFVLFDRSGGWAPEGALPWTWADRALRAVVASHIGHASVPLEPEYHDGPQVDASHAAPARCDFDALAEGDHTVGLLRAAIGLVASGRDAEVHIEYQLQKAGGDPSPSHTVASMTGLSHANIRQIDRRVRQRLERLAQDEPHYAPLLELEWLEPGRASRRPGAVEPDLVSVA